MDAFVRTHQSVGPLDRVSPGPRFLTEAESRYSTQHLLRSYHDLSKSRSLWPYFMYIQNPRSESGQVVYTSLLFSSSRRIIQTTSGMATCLRPPGDASGRVLSVDERSYVHRHHHIYIQAPAYTSSHTCADTYPAPPPPFPLVHRVICLSSLARQPGLLQEQEDEEAEGRANEGEEEKSSTSSPQRLGLTEMPPSSSSAISAPPRPTCDLQSSPSLLSGAFFCVGLRTEEKYEIVEDRENLTRRKVWKRKENTRRPEARDTPSGVSPPTRLVLPFLLLLYPRAAYSLPPDTDKRTEAYADTGPRENPSAISSFLAS